MPMIGASPTPPAMNTIPLVSRRATVKLPWGPSRYARVPGAMLPMPLVKSPLSLIVKAMRGQMTKIKPDELAGGEAHSLTTRGLDNDFPHAVGNLAVRYHPIRFT